MRRIEVSHPSGVLRKKDRRYIRPVESLVWHAPNAAMTVGSSMR